MRITTEALDNNENSDNRKGVSDAGKPGSKCCTTLKGMETKPGDKIISRITGREIEIGKSHWCS